jgi:hypothetical protein
MRRSVAAPETGADALVAALAEAPAVLDAQGDTAVPEVRVAEAVATRVAAAVALAAVTEAAAGSGGIADRAMPVTAAAAEAGMTEGRPVTGKVTGMSGRARIVTVAPTVVLTVPPTEGATTVVLTVAPTVGVTTVAPTVMVDVRPMAVRREVPSAVGAAGDR